MARKSKRAGLYGAEGVAGGKAAAQRLSELAGGIRSAVETERGLSARLNYLTKSQRGMDAMDAAGIDVSQRTLTRWLADEQSPSKANLARIEAAYQSLHRERVADRLREQLGNGGRGTRIEIHPVDQARVDEGYRRDIASREINISADKWDELIDAWMDDDDLRYEGWWDGVCDDCGTDGAAYASVAAVGF